MVFTKQLGDAIAASTGAADAGKAIKSDSTGKIDPSLNNLVGRPVSSEGGRVVLAYPGNASAIGEAASTWVLGVAADNSLRVYRRNSANVLLTPLQISEGGAVSGGNYSASSSYGFISDVSSGSQGTLSFRTGGSIRWDVLKDNAAESGGNAGSDFAINRYSDSGSYLNTPFKITRSNAFINFGGSIGSGSGSSWSMTTAGLLTTSNDTLNQNTAAGANGRMFWQSGGINRWAAGKNSTAESGSNAGSDWQLWAYDDSGNFLRNPLTVTRSSGNVQIGTGLIVTNSGAIVSTGVGLGSVSGNTRGTGAIDLQINRAAATQVASGSYSFVVGQNNTASGANSVAIGQGCAATQTNSMALGRNATTKRAGELAFSGAASFAAAGDAQTSEMVLVGTTTNATPLTLTSPTRITLNDSTTIVFEILVVGRRSAVNESAGYHFRGVIDRNSGAASTRIVGIVSKTTIAEDQMLWDANVSADSTNGAIQIQVTGEASKTIGWVAYARLVEIVLA